MEIGVLDAISYKSAQAAQASYFLSLRELARADHVSAACLLNITKEEARRLANLPVHTLQSVLQDSPPILEIRGQSSIKGASSFGALISSMETGAESFSTTAAHINAFVQPIHEDPLPSGLNKSKDNLWIISGDEQDVA